MNIIAFSDCHGDLPTIKEKTDIVLMAGDFSPLIYQFNYFDMSYWLRQVMLPYIQTLRCEKFVFIAGNHDFICTKNDFKEEFKQYLKAYRLLDKVVYLENESFEHNGIKIYGCPYSDIQGWAFSTSKNPDGYKGIEENTDILLVHQPPQYGDMGVVGERNFGSVMLLEEIIKKKPRYVICGHIHEGNHNMVKLNDTKMYNVSIKNEEYKAFKKPLTLSI